GGLGADSSGAYDMRIQPKHGAAQTFSALKYGDRFEKLEWIGFVSTGTNAATFYLDNLKLSERR
ncbi:MAG: hypothetical protein HON70_09005, partial [Lentisphaerae bacterium]|nr:hypothetical protein [Lentisphaerota bacterium]